MRTRQRQSRQAAKAMRQIARDTSDVASGETKTTPELTAVDVETGMCMAVPLKTENITFNTYQLAYNNS